MKELLLQILNSTDPSINPIYSNLASLNPNWNTSSISNSIPFGAESFIVDKIIISPNQLSSIKLNQLSEFMRTEILQHQLGT
jgi:hypothetical protein